MSGNWRVGEDGVIYANSLCLRNSSGQNVCINADQLQSLTGVAPSQGVVDTPQEVVQDNTNSTSSTSTNENNANLNNEIIDNSSNSSTTTDIVTDTQNNP
jgi:hypothetical protein